MSLSKVDREIYMSLYNLTRSKNARKGFICKKCKKQIDIKQGLTHFDCHIDHDATGVIKYCGHCDQTFFMQNDASRELMYRRHVYECISGRSCSGKLFEVIQHTVKKDNLLSPFLVNVQRAENVNQKKSVILTDVTVGGQSSSCSATANQTTLPALPSDSVPSSSSFAVAASVDHGGGAPAF